MYYCLVLSPNLYYNSNGKKVIDGGISTSSVICNDAHVLEFSLNPFNLMVYKHIIPSSSVANTKMLYEMGIQFALDNIDNIAKVLEYKVPTYT